MVTSEPHRPPHTHTNRAHVTLLVEEVDTLSHFSCPLQSVIAAVSVTSSLAPSFPANAHSTECHRNPPGNTRRTQTWLETCQKEAFNDTDLHYKNKKNPHTSSSDSSSSSSSLSSDSLSGSSLRSGLVSEYSSFRMSSSSRP